MVYCCTFCNAPYPRDARMVDGHIVCYECWRQLYGCPAHSSFEQMRDVLGYRGISSMIADYRQYVRVWWAY